MHVRFNQIVLIWKGYFLLWLIHLVNIYGRRNITHIDGYVISVLVNLPNEYVCLPIYHANWKLLKQTTPEVWFKPYIYIYGLGKDNWKTRREISKFWDLVQLIWNVWRYLLSLSSIILNGSLPKSIIWMHPGIYVYILLILDINFLDAATASWSM